MFDATQDPLGIGLQQRATARRFQQAVDAVHSNAPAPTMLTDPKWDNYFQAVDESSDGKPVRYGYTGGNDIYTDGAGNSFAGTQDLSRDPNAVFGNMKALPMGTTGNGPSNQLGTAVRLRKTLQGMG